MFRIQAVRFDLLTSVEVERTDMRRAWIEGLTRESFIILVERKLIIYVKIKMVELKLRHSDTRVG